jgi:formylglycine-generating enzyme required for sulfatase activity
MGVRGGGRSLWPWYRNGYAPADRGNIIGFRCARAP